MSDDFEIAYRRARLRIGETRWPRLSTEAQERAVKEELEAMERERREDSGEDEA